MRLPDVKMVPLVLANPAEEAQLDVISQLFYRTANGVTSIENIGETCGLEARLAQRIAAMLVQKGLFEIDGFVLTRSESGASSTPPMRSSSEPPDPAMLELVGRCRALMSTGTFYDLLGVETDAPRSEIRMKYFELSKQLHPDRAFGRDLGDLRRHMEQVFQRLTEAYETLSHPSRRGEYDARHGIEAKPLRPSLPSATLPPQAPRTRASVAPSVPPSPRTSAIPSASAMPPPRASSVPPLRPSHPGPDDLHRRWQRERAGRALAAALGRPSMTPRPSRAPSTHLEEARLALDRERFEDAIRLLMPHLATNPDDEQCQELLETAKSGLSRMRAKNLISRGLVERRRGNFDTAEELFSRAIEVDRGNLDAKHLIAEMLVERGSNLPRALGLIKEVIAAGGQRARYYSTLGDIFCLNKETDRACDAYRRALAIDPENKELQKKLEQCVR